MYFKKGTSSIAPRAFWKECQYEFPILASVARDILSIPATGAGVERLFNSARDICHYRRGSLKSTTIQELMMFMCTTKFDIEEKELAYIKQYMTKEEEEEAAEERNAQIPAEELTDLISDNEDDELLSTIFVNSDDNPSRFTDQRGSPDSAEDNRESPEIPIAESEDDDNPLPLPPSQLTTPSGEAFHRMGDTRKRVSSRVRLPSKRLKGYTT